MMNEVTTQKIISPGKMLITFAAKDEVKLKTLQVEISLLDVITMNPDILGRMIKKELIKFNNTKF